MAGGESARPTCFRQGLARLQERRSGALGARAPQKNGGSGSAPHLRCPRDVCGCQLQQCVKQRRRPQLQQREMSWHLAFSHVHVKPLQTRCSHSPSGYPPWT